MAGHATPQNMRSVVGLVALRWVDLAGGRHRFGLKSLGRQGRQPRCVLPVDWSPSWNRHSKNVGWRSHDVYSTVPVNHGKFPVPIQGGQLFRFLAIRPRRRLAARRYVDKHTNNRPPVGQDSGPCAAEKKRLGAEMAASIGKSSSISRLSRPFNLLF